MPILSNTKKTNTLIAIIISTNAMLVNTNAYAADAVAINAFNNTNHVHTGDAISATSFSQQDSYSDNQFFNNSAWGHAGSWYTFMNHDTTDVTVSVFGDIDIAPGITVWATGGSEFDGGTTAFGLENSTAGFFTPDSFNTTGVIGSAGTLWMADNAGGNVIETLGYAVSGPTHLNSIAATGWGEDIVTGAHDVSLTNSFENGVTGSVGANSASLEFNNLASGWYTVYVGGTDHSLIGGDFDLIVSAVPETETWAMLLAGLGLIGWHLKKQQNNLNIAAA